MGYLATAAYLGALGALIFGDSAVSRGAPSELASRPYIVAFAVTVALFTWLFIAWQLINRLHAEKMVNACTTLATKWLTNPPTPSDLEPSERRPYRGVLPKAFIELLPGFDKWDNLRFLVSELRALRRLAKIHLLILVLLTFLVAARFLVIWTDP